MIDSSRLKAYGECEWKVRSHGCGKRRTWRKIHLGVDERTAEITAQLLTVNKTDDAAVLPDLGLDTLMGGVDMSKVGTNGAYDDYHCWDTLIEAKIEPVIPPRANAALAAIDEGGYEANRKGWPKQSGYHRRSKAENTFFRWKTILGEKMYAREFEN